MINLIDSDTICYMAAATSPTAEKARYNANDILNALFSDLNVRDYKLYLTGDTNFRYSIYPEYKANRLKVPKPEFLKDVKEYLVAEYNAVVSEGCEADDLLAIDQTTYNNLGMDSRIVSIDKDMLTVPGWNYNPRKKEEKLVSPRDALRYFYMQMLIGDSADGIKGVPGVGPKKAEKLLADATEEEEMFNIVRDAYSCDPAMLMNGQVLHLWRFIGDIWKPKWELESI